MYQQFFSLNKQPFSTAPDADFLFFTDQHKEALAHLTYGLQGNGGFVVLTGEVGTGKTTICRFLLQDMPANTDVASITNPDVSEIELLTEICEQLLITYDRENISSKVLFDALASWMLENHQRGRHAIVLIDEAQHLSFNVLEQLRLLTNIESDNQKPLQIILIGQTELQDKLLTTELRQLSQRITARYHLLPLNQQETLFYIQHRLTIAGSKEPVFEANAMPAIFKASHGNPLLINQICDRCLLAAFTASKSKITSQLVRKTIIEADLPKSSHLKSLYLSHASAILTIVLLVFFINMQAPAIISYFKTQEGTQIEKEWLAVMETTNAQSPSSAEIIASNASSEATPTLSLKDEAEKENIKSIIISPKNEITLTAVEAILAMPSTGYTLQLAALPNTESLQRFFEEYPALRGETYTYQGLRNGKAKYVVILGTYDAYSVSKKASKAFQTRYPKISPWIKNISTVHEELK